MDGEVGVQRNPLIVKPKAHMIGKTMSKHSIKVMLPPGLAFIILRLHLKQRQVCFILSNIKVMNSKFEQLQTKKRNILYLVHSVTMQQQQAARIPLSLSAKLPIPAAIVPLFQTVSLPLLPHSQPLLTRDLRLNSLFEVNAFSALSHTRLLWDCDMGEMSGPDLVEVGGVELLWKNLPTVNQEAMTIIIQFLLGTWAQVNLIRLIRNSFPQLIDVQ